MFQEQDIQNKKILLTLDLNENPATNGFRFQAALPTIKKLLEYKANQIILLTHWGRPEGINPEYSLEKHTEVLRELLGREVQLISGTEEEGYDEFGDLPGVYIFENLRFFDWQKLNIAQKLSQEFSVLIYDAFGLCHRDEPYTTGLIQAFGKDRVFTGLLIDREIEKINEFLENKAPKYLVLGGKKLGDKIPILESMLPKIEKVLLVGAVANAFYKTLGIKIGSSYMNLENIEGKKISENQIKKYYNSKKIILPEYVILDNKQKIKIKDSKIEKNQKIVDIDPKSYRDLDFSDYAVFWNGNAGICEDGFEEGTQEIAKLIIQAKYSLAAGGDTAKWLNQNQALAKNFAHISTGGGTALEFLAKNGDLPVFKILK